MLMIDLMTEDTAPKNLTLEVAYEYQDKSSSGYKPAKMYWLSVGEPSPPAGAAGKKQFSFNSMPMSATSSAALLYSIGHMHDGGINMNLYVSGKLVCMSKMHYNAREGYTKGRHEKRQGHAHGGSENGVDHISDPGACIDFGTVSAGERMTGEAVYDGSKYDLMTHNGKLEKLMGNMRVYVGPTSGW